MKPHAFTLVRTCPPANRSFPDKKEVTHVGNLCHADSPLPVEDAVRSPPRCDAPAVPMWCLSGAWSKITEAPPVAGTSTVDESSRAPVFTSLY